VFPLRKFSRIVLALWLILLGCTMRCLRVIPERAKASVLKMDLTEYADFQAQDLSEELYRELCRLVPDPDDFGRFLAVTMLDGRFHPQKLSTDSILYETYKPQEFQELSNAYTAIWTDIVYFPVPSDLAAFSDGFGEARSFVCDAYEASSDRAVSNTLWHHEGCDVSGVYKVPGMDPVLSMTDGVVEQIGWLPPGGYRIGIRALHGGYFYYAHLDSYEKEFSVGDAVSAGDILGYMGGTGYECEGMTGQSPVYLHVGIYIRTKIKEELAVNPYPVLRVLQKDIQSYTY
jgi:murein DD-endopeptidase MepM/ murein hydrolase activator NlpD